MSAPKIVKVCATCGSADVQADAFAIWNVDAQEWEVADVMDKGHSCGDCGGECRIVDRAENTQRARALPRVALQDGGQFYDNATGDLIENYGDTDRLAVAEKYRERFLATHPDYRMATDAEAFGTDETDAAPAKAGAA